MSSRKAKHPDVAGFFRALETESDRAVGVLAAAFLDLLLEMLFHARLSQATPPELFASRGPLADLSSKIDLAFALGWIDAETRTDLHVVRAVRNMFAHSADHALTFADAAIAARTRNMNLFRYVSRTTESLIARLPEAIRLGPDVAAARAGLQDARDIFTGAIHILANVLATTIESPFMGALPPVSLEARHDEIFVEEFPKMLAKAKERSSRLDA